MILELCRLLENCRSAHALKNRRRRSYVGPRNKTQAAFRTHFLPRSPQRARHPPAGESQRQNKQRSSTTQNRAHRQFPYLDHNFLFRAMNDKPESNSAVVHRTCCAVSVLPQNGPFPHCGGLFPVGGRTRRVRHTTSRERYVWLINFASPRARRPARKGRFFERERQDQLSEVKAAPNQRPPIPGA